MYQSQKQITTSGKGKRANILEKDTKSTLKIKEKGTPFPLGNAPSTPPLTRERQPPSAAQTQA
jgi:hypothetical protein